MKMERPWLASYPDGVAAEIEDTGGRTLIDILDSSCTTYADKVAYTNMGAELLYRDLAEQSRSFAAFLQHETGLQQGDRVALMMPNLLQYPIALFGILRAGMVVVNVNPLYTERELEQQLADAGARGIVIVENFAAKLQEALPNTTLETIVTTRIGDCLPTPRGILTNLAVKYLKHMVPAFSLPDAIRFNAAQARGAQQQMLPVTVR